MLEKDIKYKQQTAKTFLLSSSWEQIQVVHPEHGEFGAENDI